MVGALEDPLALAIGAGEGAALVAEQLALDQAGRDGAAVDGDERTVRRRLSRCTVSATSSLPVPLSPVTSTVALGRRHPRDPVVDRLHRRRRADHRAEAAELAQLVAQRADLGAEGAGAQARLEHGLQSRLVDRLARGSRRPRRAAPRPRSRASRGR